jgi:NADPH oxidase
VTPAPSGLRSESLTSLIEFRLGNAIDIHYRQPAGITGHYVQHRPRKSLFGVFWYTHHLAFFFMIGLYTHATGCFVRGTALPSFTGMHLPFYDANLCIGYLSWRYTIWPGIIYFFERVWREVRARRSTKLPKVLVRPFSAASSSRCSSTPPASGCSFKCPMFPTSSGIRWVVCRRQHVNLTDKLDSLTITSAPEDPYVSIHIRRVGDWTQALGERVGVTPAVVKSLTQADMKAFEKDDKSGMMQEGRGDFVELDTNASTRPLPVVGIDGPHGAPAEDAFKSEVAVFIGAASFSPHQKHGRSRDLQ